MQYHAMIITDLDRYGLSCARWYFVHPGAAEELIWC
jgi:hypothetical protein